MTTIEYDRKRFRADAFCQFQRFVKEFSPGAEYAAVKESELRIIAYRAALYVASGNEASALGYKGDNRSVASAAIFRQNLRLPSGIEGEFDALIAAFIMVRSTLQIKGAETESRTIDDVINNLKL